MQDMVEGTIDGKRLKINGRMDMSRLEKKGHIWTDEEGRV